MTQMANKHRFEKEFQVRDWVYLKLQPYKQEFVQHQSSYKLSPKFFGPFKVTPHVGKVIYTLDVPLGTKIHPTIHVSQLKKKVGTHIVVTTIVPSNLISTLLLKPIAILDQKMVKCGNRAATKVLVQWSNSFLEDAAWEFLFDLQ
ncbi:hypothetical protein SLE2022_262730 [Rubroshorea leprosula]